MSDIASGIEPGSSAGFTVGNVLERSFSILGRNFVPFFLLSAVAALPYLAFYLTIGAVPAAGADPAARVNAAAMVSPAAVGLPLILGFVLKMIVQAMILNAAFQDMRGRKVSIGESFRVGLSRFFPIIGIIILMGLGILLGMILLFVPGIILMLMWYVALPACVVEGLGPITSLGRSAALTKGHRWQILGLILVVGIVGGIIGAVAGAIGATFGLVGIAIVQYLVQAIVGVYGAVLIIVLYRDLRVAKEGIGTEQIAAVFD